MRAQFKGSNSCNCKSSLRFGELCGLNQYGTHQIRFLRICSPTYSSYSVDRWHAQFKKSQYDCTANTLLAKTNLFALPLFHHHWCVRECVRASVRACVCVCVVSALARAHSLTHSHTHTHTHTHTQSGKARVH